MRSKTKQQVIIFQIGENRFALSLLNVREILHIAALTSPPGLPKFLEGFLNLAGNAVPVLRLDRLLGLAEQKTGLYTQLIITKNLEVSVAFMVDRVEAIWEVSQQDMVPVRKKSTFNDCVQKAVQVNGYTAHLISPEKVLLKEEQETMQEFQTIARKRLENLRKKSRARK